MTKFLKQLLCGAAMLAFGAAQAGAAVNNGDFETGDLSGWTLNGSTETNWVDTGVQHGGDYAAALGEFGATATLSQSLATVAGQTYTVSFWLANLGGSEANINTVSSFEVLAGGNSLWLLSDKTATDYTAYLVHFIATAGSTELVFAARHDENFWLLDDISVSAVPEPSTVLLLIAGLGLIALQRRRNPAA
jgi:hypothetical protein